MNGLKWSVRVRLVLMNDRVTDSGEKRKVRAVFYEVLVESNRMPATVQCYCKKSNPVLEESFVPSI